MRQSPNSDGPCLLVTGGCGYIGANLIHVLSERGYKIKVLDDFSSGFAERLIGYEVEIIQGSMLDAKSLNASLTGVDLVVHLAAKKSVVESQKRPEYYFEQNVIATNCLLKEMVRHSISQLIFASTAAVYAPNNAIVNELDPIAPMSVYGETKIQNEVDILQYVSLGINSSIFRFANVLGAINGLKDSSGSNLLMSSISRTQLGLPLQIYGDDYETPDGTCVRDFIHIADLVDAIVIQIEIGIDDGCKTFNLGTGVGTSVKIFLENYMKVVKGQKLVIGPRQDGDLPFSILDPSSYQPHTKWQANRNIVDMITSSMNLR